MSPHSSIGVFPVVFQGHTLRAAAGQPRSVTIKYLLENIKIFQFLTIECIQLSDAEIFKTISKRTSTEVHEAAKG